MPIHSRRAWVKELFRQVPFHTFLLAAYPILGLLAVNIDQIYARDAIKSLTITLSISAAVILGLWILTRNWQIAGLLTSLLVAWFFLYGRLYLPVKSLSVFGFILGRHRYLLLAWSGIIMAAAVWIMKRSRINLELTMIVNIFSSVLILLPSIQISAFQLRNPGQPRNPEDRPSAQMISWSDRSNPPPDIYYIVLDGYARSDVVRQVYDLDNSAFLEGLRELGFYVAECARSNYSRTLHSLTSTFSMEYVQTLESGIAPDADQAWLFPYFKHNLVRQQLEGLGYETIVFKHPYERFIWDDAAIVYESSGTAALSPFEYLLLRTTAARVYLDVHEAETRQLANYTNYEDTQYALRQLQNLPALRGPQFVFAHLIIPHSPFVFGPDGEYIDIPYDADAGNIYAREDGIRGYTSALTYINKKMLEIVPQLIRDSITPPIIVLAGDHGTPWGGNLNEVKNLAAFYTPGVDTPFYETITPVNIFRILFNEYFAGSFELLPDTSYLFTELGRFDFREFPNVCDLTD